MEKTVKEFMEHLLAELQNIDYVKPEDIIYGSNYHIHGRAARSM